MPDTTSDRFVVTQALCAWAQLVLSLRKEQVLDAPFQGTRPPTAYLIVERVTSTTVSEPWAEQEQDDEETVIQRGVIMKQDLFQIRCFGEESSNWPERLERSRVRDDVIALFDDKGVSVFATDTLDVRDIVRDRARWELGSILEVRVSYFSVDAATYVGAPLLEEVVVANSPAPLYTLTVEVPE